MTGIMEVEPGALSGIGESLDRGSRRLHKHIDIDVPKDMPGADALARGQEAFRERLQDQFNWAKWMADECESTANDFINTDYAVSEDVRLQHMSPLQGLVYNPDDPFNLTAPRTPYPSLTLPQPLPQPTPSQED